MSIQATTRRSSVKSDLRTLSTAQLRLLLDFTDKDQSIRDLHDVAMIISNTGLRAGELGQLRWIDVDFERRALCITKDKRGYMRYVRFGVETLHILKERREREPKVDYVFGRIINRVTRQLKEVCAKIGLRDVTPIVLRRTFMKFWIDSGGSITSLTKIMGWTSYPLWTKDVHGSEPGFEAAARDQARIEESQCQKIWSK